MLKCPSAHAISAPDGRTAGWLLSCTVAFRANQHTCAQSTNAPPVALARVGADVLAADPLQCLRVNQLCTPYLGTSHSCLELTSWGRAVLLGHQDPPKPLRQSLFRQAPLTTSSRRASTSQPRLHSALCTLHSAHRLRSRSPFCRASSSSFNRLCRSIHQGYIAVIDSEDYS